MSRDPHDLVNRSRIAVDWDGTCITDHAWPEMGEWLPGAVDALRKLSEIYDEVVIFTLRVAPFEIDEKTPRDPRDQYVAIRGMLDDAGLPFKRIRVWDKPFKPPAEFYIDDRGIEFNGDWPGALAQVGLRRLFAKQSVFTNHQEETRVNEDQEIKTDREACTDGNCPCREEKPYHPDDDSHLYIEGAYMRQYDPESEPNAARVEEQVMRQFETGATRNVDNDQLDYEGFLSPLSLWAFASYMHRNRFQADGNVRDSDNWQKGIPVDSYRKSLIRHVMDVWLNERGFTHLSREDTVTALCAIIFNAQGLLHETLKADI